MNIKEDIRQALAAQQKLKESELRAQVNNSSDQHTENDAAWVRYKAECATQIQKLEQFITMSQLPILLSEAKEELHGKIETKRTLWNEKPDHVPYFLPTYTGDTYILKWNILYVNILVTNL